MSKRALILEAASLKHQQCHFPHNPYCEICVRARMRQHSANKKKERHDDGLPPVKGPLERLSVDTMFHHRSREGKMSTYCSFTIRDEYSRCGLGFPRRDRSQSSNYDDLKHFAGV